MMVKHFFRAICIASGMIAIGLYIAFFSSHELLDTTTIALIILATFLILLISGKLFISFIVPSYFHQWLSTDNNAPGYVCILLIAITFSICHMFIHMNEAHPRGPIQTFNGIVYSTYFTDGGRGGKRYFVDLLINNKIIHLNNKQLYDDLSTGDSIKLTVQQVIVRHSHV